MIDESMDKEQMKQPVKPDEFRAKPAWQRLLVMVAGVMMNVLLAIGIYIGICYTWGDAYFANEDARWGYNFNEAGHRLGFRDGDRFVSIDGEPVDDIAGALHALLITEGGRKVVVERGGEEVTLDLTLEELIAMRQQKGYEGLFTLRVPFLLDSCASAAAVAALRPGDELVGLDDLQGLDYPAYRTYLATRGGDSVRLDVLRGGERMSMVLPVSEEGKLGVFSRNPYSYRTRSYTFAEAIPAGIRKTVILLASYWEQLKRIVQPKT